MTSPSMLIANRGEIAIRIARAGASLGIETVAVYPEDDARSLHVKAADRSTLLPGKGVAAYLDAEALVGLARENGCTAIHPGYGFLSEDAGFARLCAENAITFIGPQPSLLELFGDKTRALQLARDKGVPTLRSTGDVDAAGARDFLESLGADGAMLIKAAAGGGGRGMRLVQDGQAIADAVEACRREAAKAFGSDAVYAEEYLPHARHVEVQVIGDGNAVMHLGERDCTIQRRHQKLIEIAPSPFIAPETRQRLADAALTMARAVNYSSLGTFEFLVAGKGDEARIAFIEANPRLQVEHTVTEEVSGLDLVAAQIRIALGESLADLGLDPECPPQPTGYALQLRVNAETLDAQGDLRAETGTVSAFEVPTGPGIRIDAAAYRGYSVSPAFDAMIAKVIVHSRAEEFAATRKLAERALAEFRIEGVQTNLPLLGAVVGSQAFANGEIHTRFVEENIANLAEAEHTTRYFADAHGHGDGAAGASYEPIPGTEPLLARTSGVVQHFRLAEGEQFVPGQPLAVLEAMKMEHELRADGGGEIARLLVEPGDAVAEGQALLLYRPLHLEGRHDDGSERPDPDYIRPDLAEMLERRRIMTDEGRPEAVAKRHKLGMRTARENIADLVDPDSFVEYGAFTLSNQRARRTYEENLRLSPNDGIVTGLASINGDRFGEEQSRAAVMSYDWTVFAGTQGYKGHEKTNRLLYVVEEMRLPLVLLSEGGGGRPGDDWGAAHLNGVSFWTFGKLSGLVPLVGINNRYCFAGNAALLGMCDVIIATRSSSIGMGGPAMIEGGGLGKYHPSEVGPADIQFANGVIDVLVEDEAQAIAVAKQYLSYFQGRLEDWDAPDQRLLRHVIPENRVRTYNIREVVHMLADTDSVLELRAGFGAGCITALVRIEGRPIGLIANNPDHLGGAIDADAADKSARFMQLCDAFDLPIVMLCDTPGFMVGPEVERQAQVRHAARLYSVAANLQVPIFAVVLRKGYGLGAQGATGGSLHAPMMTVAWPTGEFGGMGLEGAVRLAYAKELEAESDPEAREALYRKHLDELYQKGKALSVAEYFEIDDVIDPADTRKWIMRGLKSMPPRPVREGKRRPNIDPW